jgi:gliding motility-associated-like protein
MVKLRLLLPPLFLFCINLSAQDLSGLWQGVSYPKNTTSYYVFTLNLQQTGSNITGIALTKSVRFPAYAIQAVKGTVSGSVFAFADQAIIDSTATNGSWCMRYGDLTYDSALEKLSGNDIQSTNCGGAIIMELYRLKIYVDTNICNAKNVNIRATGQNLRWYKDSTKQTLIFKGDAINPYISQDTVFYVTQTIYDTESPAVPVKIHLKNEVRKQTIKLCAGQSIAVGDTVYKTSGLYTKILLNAKGCDSIVITDLSIDKALISNQYPTICEGEKVVVGDTVYRTTGIYTKRFTLSTSCDSFVITNLTVNPIKKISQDIRLCNGRSFSVGDTIYKTEGTYVKNFRVYTGCDSLVTTNLKIINEVVFSQKMRLCDGLSVAVGDTSYKTSGIYVKKLRSTEGCDSIVTTDLTIVKLDLKVSHDTLINLGDSVKVSASINLPLSVSWKWTPNVLVKCDTCPITWVKPPKTTVFQVEVFEKESKCRKTGTVSVKTKSDCPLFVPTAFSPNGDNINDKWMIYPSNCVKTIKRVAVFNRWGDLILSKNEIAVSSIQGIEIWDGLIDGKNTETDIFVYFIEAEYTNGISEVIGGDFRIMN